MSPLLRGRPGASTPTSERPIAFPRKVFYRYRRPAIDGHCPAELVNANVENLSWQDCLARYDRAHTFFYADPPYWQTEGYGVPFDFDQYR